MCGGTPTEPATADRATCGRTEREERERAARLSGCSQYGLDLHDALPRRAVQSGKSGVTRAQTRSYRERCRARSPRGSHGEIRRGRGERKGLVDSEEDSNAYELTARE